MVYPKKTERLTQRGIAAGLGVSAMAVTKLKRSGMPVDSIESAREWRRKNLNIAQRKPDLMSDNTVNTEEKFQEARTRREISAANLSEMMEAEERRDLIRVDAVKAALANVFASTRDALLQIPARIAPGLAAEADASAVANILQSEIHRALELLSGASERIGKQTHERTRPDRVALSL